MPKYFSLIGFNKRKELHPLLFRTIDNKSEITNLSFKKIKDSQCSKNDDTLIEFPTKKAFYVLNMLKFSPIYNFFIEGTEEHKMIFTLLGKSAEISLMIIDKNLRDGKYKKMHEFENSLRKVFNQVEKSESEDIRKIGIDANLNLTNVLIECFPNYTPDQIIKDKGPEKSGPCFPSSHLLVKPLFASLWRYEAARFPRRRGTRVPATDLRSNADRKPCGNGQTSLHQ